jgi:hypothetical protein
VSRSIDEPTAVVPLPPTPTEGHVGAHRRPEPEPEPEPFTQTTEPVAFTSDAPPASPPPADFPPMPPPPPGPPPSAPSPFDYPTTPPPSGPPPAAPNPNRTAIIGYAAACAVLLAALVFAIVYGLFIKESSDVEISSGGTTTSDATDAPTTTGDGGWGETSETETESPTTVAETGDATDGQLSFTVHDVEVGTTVVSSDAPIEKTAVGEYIVVHMTVTNVSPDPATFLGTFQKLLAGGTTYNIDDEATFYVGGGIAELPPGASADVSVAFDVPPGTEAEAIELHADPISPGVEVSLS